MKQSRPDKVLSLLSIAAKSGNIVSGEFSTESALKDGKAFMVILAEDASDNTKKHFSDMCNFRQVRFLTYSDKETLGHCIGKEFRASLAITDKGLADAVEKKLIVNLSNNGGSL